MVSFIRLTDLLPEVQAALPPHLDREVLKEAVASELWPRN